MKNDFHHKTNRSTPASTQSRTSTGQYATQAKPKTTKTWHLKLMLGLAIAALLTIGAFRVYNMIDERGFERGRIYGAQEERDHQKEVNELREQLISEITAEKK